MPRAWYYRKWLIGVAGSVVTAIVLLVSGVPIVIVVVMIAAFNYAMAIILDMISGGDGHGRKRPGRAPRTKTIRREDP